MSDASPHKPAWERDLIPYSMLTRFADENLSDVVWKCLNGLHYTPNEPKQTWQ